MNDKRCPEWRRADSTACTHPVCPVHRTADEQAAAHKAWADLIAALQGRND